MTSFKSNMAYSDCIEPKVISYMLSYHTKVFFKITPKLSDKNYLITKNIIAKINQKIIDEYVT